MTKPSLHHLQYRVVLQSIYNEKKTSTAHSEVLLTQVGSANNAFYVSVKYYLCLRHRSSLTQLPKNNTLTDLRRMFSTDFFVVWPQKDDDWEPEHSAHAHTPFVLDTPGQFCCCTCQPQKFTLFESWAFKLCSSWLVEDGKGEGHRVLLWVVRDTLAQFGLNLKLTKKSWWHVKYVKSTRAQLWMCLLTVFSLQMEDDVEVELELEKQVKLSSFDFFLHICNFWICQETNTNPCK